MPIDPRDRRHLSLQNWETKLRGGDMLFIRSHTANSHYIALLSGPIADPEDEKVFTHCGLVFREDGELKVYEGAGRANPNDVLTLTQWQAHEADGHSSHVFVRRWKAADELTPEKLDEILARAKQLHHTHYDTGFLWSSDSKIYCSELIWKAYDAAELPPLPLPTMGTYMAALSPKQREGGMQKLSEGRNGAAVTKDEPALSPEDIYNSDKLISVDDDTP